MPNPLWEFEHIPGEVTEIHVTEGQVKAFMNLEGKTFSKAVMEICEELTCPDFSKRS